MCEMDNIPYLTGFEWKWLQCDSYNEMFSVDKQRQYDPDTAQNRAWVHYACFSKYHRLLKLTDETMSRQK